MMNNSNQGKGQEKDVLRVALDKSASQAYAAIVKRIKAENSCVKLHPSAFVSFLVSDFYATYFEKDLGILVSEFFDSQTYHETEIKRAKSQGNFEQVMTEALVTIKKVKSNVRRTVVRRKSRDE